MSLQANITSMSSTTVFTAYPRSSADDEWKYSQVANSIMLLIGSWYVIALVIHLKRRQALVHQSWNQFDENSMLRTMLYSGVCFLIRVLSSGLIIHVPYMNVFQSQEACNHACEAFYDVSILAYGIAQFLIYLYLWFQMKVS